jgi:Autotransporter beta-domain
VFRNGLVLGAVFNYGHEFGDYDGGGDFDHDAYGILVYGSVIPIPNVFVDVAAGYTRKDYSFDRRVDVVANGVPVNGIARGDTDGNEFRIGVNTGYDFVLGRFTVGPRVGVTYRDIAMGVPGVREVPPSSWLRQPEHPVADHHGRALRVGGPEHRVRRHRAGASMEYVHEFLDDQRSVGFRLVEDLSGNRYVDQTDPPDRDYVNLGVDVSMVLPNGMQPVPVLP